MLREQQLFTKYSKCDFFKDTIQYLGHIVSKDGTSVDPDKIKDIIEWPIINNVTNIRLFMGITGYYRQFIEGFSKIAYCCNLTDHIKLPIIHTKTYININRDER